MLLSFKYLQKTVAKTISSDKVRTIVEIGANKCTESIDFFNAYPKAEIYPFECNPDTIPLCREAVKSFPRIHLIEKAVTENGGPVDFFPIDTKNAVTTHADGNTGASSLFKRNDDVADLPEKLPQKKVTVDSVTLESFMRDKGIETIDILWLDAQGAELMILKGLKERLADVKIVLCEVEFVEEYKGQPMYMDIRKFLCENGFVFCGFSDEWYPQAADGLFIQKTVFSGADAVTRILYSAIASLPVAPLIYRRIMWRFRRWYAGYK